MEDAWVPEERNASVLLGRRRLSLFRKETPGLFRKGTPKFLMEAIPEVLRKETLGFLEKETLEAPRLGVPIFLVK